MTPSNTSSPRNLKILIAKDTCDDAIRRALEQAGESDYAVKSQSRYGMTSHPGEERSSHGKDLGGG